MGRFFVDWALWEKMCFVLGCAIVLTFLAGFIKVAWNHWRLQKYTAIAEARNLHLQEMRRSRDIIQLKGQDVPFGVRAIESGIEVDGVWISRPNSPVPSIRSLALSSPGAMTPISSSESSPQKPSPSSLETKDRLPVPQPARSLHPPVSTKCPLLARPASVDGLPSRSQPSTPTFDPRRSYQSKPHMRYSDDGLQLYRANRTHSEGQNSAAEKTTSSHHSSLLVETMFHRDLQLSSPGSGSARSSFSDVPLDHEGPFDGRRSWTKETDADQTEECPSSSSSSSEAGNTSRRYHHQRYSSAGGNPFIDINGHRRSNSSASRASRASRGRDLQLLHSHRVSHAAEVGQLRPRSKQSPVGADWARSVQTSSHHSDPGADYFNERHAASVADSDDDPFITPMEHPDLKQSKQNATVPETCANLPVSEAPTQAFPQLTRGQDHKVESVEAPVLQVSDANQNIPNKRTIRRVNSGFEVLTDTSFSTADPKGKGVDRSEEFKLDLEAGENRQHGHKHKRLQKKGRPKSVAKGRLSHFKESI